VKCVPRPGADQEAPARAPLAPLAPLADGALEDLAHVGRRRAQLVLDRLALDEAQVSRQPPARRVDGERAQRLARLPRRGS